MYKYIITITLVLAVFCFTLGTAYAQMEFMVDGYEEKYMNHDEGPGAEIPSSKAMGGNDRYIYEEPTVKALSYMFWALDHYKVSDNNAVDEFLRINECDLYKKFSGDELEWQDIRAGAKKFIKANKKDFPTRFIFVTPLKLGDYSSRRQAFALQEGYMIPALRRFELYAKNPHAKSCVADFDVMKSYPRIINLEFSRPFSLTHIPMTEEKANAYIKRTRAAYHRRYPERLRNKRLMYSFRNAFLVMKIKVFAVGDIITSARDRYPKIKAMGVLESYSIFADPDLTDFIYAQSYVSNKKKGKLDIKLTEQYEVLRERSNGDGMLNY